MNVDEVEARRCPPVPEQPGLDVFLGERLSQERVDVEVDLPDREIVRRTPVRVDLLELVGGEGRWLVSHREAPCCQGSRSCTDTAGGFVEAHAHPLATSPEASVGRKSSEPPR